MSAPRLPAPGDLLAQRYRIIRLMGEGGMGAVLEAENTITQKRVAIKVLHPELGENSQAAQRLLREAQASCRIRHPNVVDVYDVGYDGDSLFLIMELLDGEPLSAMLQRGGVDAHEFIRIVLCAMRGVAEAHRVGVIHRDIHPGNIFLSREGGDASMVPKVLDFGISKIRDSQLRALTATGVAMGTPLYMSYEQLCNAREIDARTDVYAFGVILYQGLTGRPTFEAKVVAELFVKLATTSPIPPKDLCPEIPVALDTLICWALERDRDSRVPTMEAFIAELIPFASAHAFRTARADSQRTLPAVVPRASILPMLSPVAALEAAALTVAEAGYGAATPDVVSAAPSVRPTRSREAKLLPMLFVSAATLFVLGLGTYLLRRSRASSPSETVATEPRKAAAPGYVVHGKEQRGTGLDAGAAAVAKGNAASSAPLPDAALLPSSRLYDASAPLSASSRPEAPPASMNTRGEGQRSPEATPEKPGRRARRFRAGEARASDF